MKRIVPESREFATCENGLVCPCPPVEYLYRASDKSAGSASICPSRMSVVGPETSLPQAGHAAVPENLSPSADTTTLETHLSDNEAASGAM